MRDHAYVTVALPGSLRGPKAVTVLFYCDSYLSFPLSGLLLYL